MAAMAGKVRRHRSPLSKVKGGISQDLLYLQATAALSKSKPSMIILTPCFRTQALAQCIVHPGILVPVSHRDTSSSIPVMG